MNREQRMAKLRANAAIYKQKLDTKCEAHRRQTQPEYAARMEYEAKVNQYGPPIIRSDKGWVPNPRWPKAKVEYSDPRCLHALIERHGPPVKMRFGASGEPVFTDNPDWPKYQRASRQKWEYRRKLLNNWNRYHRAPVNSPGNNGD